MTEPVRPRGSQPEESREPPLYRPFALVAFAATLLGGTPLGIWMLAWLYLGAAAVPPEWVLLHAHLQVFGFFGTLILGVAQHLLPRFTGRPVSRSPLMLRLLGLQGLGLALRALGTARHGPALVLVASLLQAGVFLVFARWVWQMLDPRPLVPLRWHLTISTAWLAAACALEAWTRGRALAAGLPLPPLAELSLVHAMGLYGGILGWVLGVLLRAGPMFVAGWRSPARAMRALPWLLALGLGVALSGGTAGGNAAVALARLGELIALMGAAAFLLLGGAPGSARGALPMVARGPAESRIFRVAMLSAGAAVLGGAAAVMAAWAGLDVRVLADAVRHLVTVGLLTSVVVAMAFRLIPVLEGRALPWPRLRGVALGSLAGGIVLRTAEVPVSLGGTALAAWIPASGILIWLAIACVCANLVGAIRRRPCEAGVPAPSRAG